MNNGKYIETFLSKKEASVFSGERQGSIIHACAACDGYHRCGNYLWYYYDDTKCNDVEPWKKK